MNGLDKEEQQKDDEAWYSSLIKEDDFLAQDAGGKITVLFEILRLANECDDKVYVTDDLHIFYLSVPESLLMLWKLCKNGMEMNVLKV